MAKKPDLRVAKRSLAELTADALREAILSGELPPGGRLTEVELARETGASRGTVREALAALQQEGLVDCVRYSAWSVAELDDRTLWEVYTLRATLESGAARLLASNVTRADISAIRSAETALSEADASGSPDERAAADLAFHGLIVERCGNRLLAESYGRIANKVRWVYSVAEGASPARIDLPAWHRPLADALCAGRSDEAARLVFDMCLASLEDDLRDRLEQARQQVTAS